MPALTPFVGFPIPLIDKITNLCCNLCQVASGCSFLLVLPAVWLSLECVVRWKVSVSTTYLWTWGFIGIFLLFTAFAKPLLMPPPLQHTPSLNLFSQITTFYTSQCHGFLPLSVPLPSAFIVSYVCVRAQSCITLCSFMGYSPPGSSIQGIFQARVLEWVVISFSRDLYHIEANLLCSLLPHC